MTSTEPSGATGDLAGVPLLVTAVTMISTLSCGRHPHDATRGDEGRDVAKSSRTAHIQMEIAHGDEDLSIMERSKKASWGVRMTDKTCKQGSSSL